MHVWVVEAFDRASGQWVPLLADVLWSRGNARKRARELKVFHIVRVRKYVRAA